MNVNMRANASPDIHRTKRGYRIQAKILTPLRAALVMDTVYWGLRKLWFGCLVLIALDWLSQLFGWFSPIGSLRLEMNQLMYLIVGLPIVYSLEMLSKMQLACWLFGRWITIEVTKDHVHFKGARSNFRVPRTDWPVFNLVQLDAAKNPFYQDSRVIQMTINNLRAVRLVECFHARKATAIVVNANYLINHGDATSDTETDPRYED